MSDQADLESILREAERIAVVGWSTDPDRSSHEVADYLDRAGYTILPVNPNYEGTDAYGTQVVGHLTDLQDIDVVDVFRRPEAVVDHVDAAIELGAPVFWMQLGISNEAAARRLREAGITVVQDRCMMAEHRRRGP